MARGNHSDKNLRNEAQAQLDDLSDERAGLGYEADEEATGYIGDEMGTNQTGSAAGAGAGAGATAMRTKATPKTAAQQSMQSKKGNQPPNR